MLLLHPDLSVAPKPSGDSADFDAKAGLVE